MQILKNMKLGTMLGSGFILVILIGFTVAIFGRSQLIHVGNNLDYLSNIRLNNLIAMQEIKDNFNAAARIIRESAIQTDTTLLAQEKRHLDTLIERNNSLLRLLDEKLKLKKITGIAGAAQSGTSALFQCDKKSHGTEHERPARTGPCVNSG
ncbi:hypothetical protein OS21_47550 [Dickeya oryzae]